MKIMTGHPELKYIFKLAYDPFLKYKLPKKKIENFLDSCDYGTNSLQESHYLSIESIALKKTSTKPFDVLTILFSSLTQKDADILRRIVNKNLEIGVNRKTVERVWPDLLSGTEDGKPKIPVMLCQPFDELRLEFPCLVSVKLDGIRARYIHKKLYSRQGKIIKGMDHILNRLKDFDEELDGELTIPGKDFDEASGLIRNSDQTPEAVYNVFDSPSMSFGKEDRYLSLKKTLYLLDSPFSLVPQYKRFSLSAVLEFYETAIKDGEEGIVICTAEGKYENKRSWSWMKLVPVLSKDLRCDSFFEGTGKNKGKLGGIVVEFKGERVRVGTGFSDEQREKIWNNTIHYSNKIAEIEYKGVTAYDCLRMPRFKRWREDKNE